MYIYIYIYYIYIWLFFSLARTAQLTLLCAQCEDCSSMLCLRTDNRARKINDFRVGVGWCYEGSFAIAHFLDATMPD